MNRRNFLSLAALAIAGKAAERVFPFRVYSIPKEIVVAAHPINSLFGVPANDLHMYDTQRVFMNLSRSAYPGRISTPNIFGSSAYLTPELIRRAVKQFEAEHN